MNTCSVHELPMLFDGPADGSHSPSKRENTFVCVCVCVCFLPSGVRLPLICLCHEKGSAVAFPREMPSRSLSTNA